MAYICLLLTYIRFRLTSTHLIKYKRREKKPLIKSYELQVLKLRAIYYTAYFELWICCWAEEQVDNESYKYVYCIGCAWISSGGGGALVVRIRARSALDYVGQDVTSCTSFISGLASSLAKGHSLPS